MDILIQTRLVCFEKTKIWTFSFSSAHACNFWWYKILKVRQLRGHVWLVWELNPAHYIAEMQEVASTTGWTNEMLETECIELSSILSTCKTVRHYLALWQPPDWSRSCEYIQTMTAGCTVYSKKRILTNKGYPGGQQFKHDCWPKAPVLITWILVITHMPQHSSTARQIIPLKTVLL